MTQRLTTPVFALQIDNVGIIYYDRDIMSKVDKAGFCKPCCTHNSPCPTCCDMYVCRAPLRKVWMCRH